ncbi:MAG: hypothetical protein NT122_02960, partial [Solirubrobacterales bacterium]|nr:hypothetical protein [Solirubrobacterales bacterium]
APDMAEAQGIRSVDLLRDGIVDAIVPELPDAADEPAAFSGRIADAIVRELRELSTLEAAARTQLGGWYGSLVDSWKTLRIDRIENALPAMPVGSLDPAERPLRLRSWLWVAGDHRSTSSIEGAMASGRHAGEQIAAASDEPR